MPSEFDDVHRPELSPVVEISTPASGEEFGFNQKISVGVSQIKGSPLSRVEFFVGNSFLGSIKNPPFVFSFIPNDFNLPIKEMELVAVAYDNVLNKGRASVSIKIK